MRAGGPQRVRPRYRHVDTAENYENEAPPVGKAVRESGDRSLRTVRDHQVQPEVARGGRRRRRPGGNLERLGLDYVDLLLIHWPNPDQDLYVKAFETLIELKEQGLARAIGLSNFKPAHIERILAATGVTPPM